MRIGLLGDSITQGLGSKKVNFMDELSNLLNTTDSIYNFAHTGTTIEYVSSIYEEILDRKIEIAIILYGNVDAMLKPKRNGKIFKFLPRRFRLNKGSMLLPRPFYSHKRAKRFAQKIENIFRSIFRHTIYYIDGTEQWKPFEDFKNEYTSVCRWMFEHKITPLICSTVFIDNKLFPNTPEEYIKYNLWLKEYATENQLLFIDLFNILKQLVNTEGWMKYYNYDHFHPNGFGYKVIANVLANELRKLDTHKQI